jgi:hypothetical protein
MAVRQSLAEGGRGDTGRPQSLVVGSGDVDRSQSQPPPPDMARLVAASFNAFNTSISFTNKSSVADPEPDPQPLTNGSGSESCKCIAHLVRVQVTELREGRLFMFEDEAG